MFILNVVCCLHPRPRNTYGGKQYKQIGIINSLRKERVREYPFTGVAVVPGRQWELSEGQRGLTAPGGRELAWLELLIGLARYCLDEDLR